VCYAELYILVLQGGQGSAWYRQAHTHKCKDKVLLLGASRPTTVLSIQLVIAFQMYFMCDGQGLTKYASIMFGIIGSLST